MDIKKLNEELDIILGESNESDVKIWYKTNGDISCIRKYYGDNKDYSYSFYPERNETKEECIKILDKWNKEHGKVLSGHDTLVDNFMIYNK